MFPITKKEQEEAFLRLSAPMCLHRISWNIHGAEKKEEERNQDDPDNLRLCFVIWERRAAWDVRTHILWTFTALIAAHLRLVPFASEAGSG